MFQKTYQLSSDIHLPEALGSGKKGCMEGYPCLLAAWIQLFIPLNSKQLSPPGDFILS